MISKGREAHERLMSHQAGDKRVHFKGVPIQCPRSGGFQNGWRILQDIRTATLAVPYTPSILYVQHLGRAGYRSLYAE